MFRVAKTAKKADLTRRQNKDYMGKGREPTRGSRVMRDKLEQNIMIHMYKMPSESFHFKC